MINDVIKESIECVVIGAGVVGLSIARSLASVGYDVIIVEATDGIGNGISSRNSEVIHSGIYYPKNFLKSSLCVQGKELLYRYLKDHNIAYKQCGKLVVATNDQQLTKLENIQNNGIDNGVSDLKMLSCSDVKYIEPDITCNGALFSPSTGILDTHDFMLSLLGEFEGYGGRCSFLTNVIKASSSGDGVDLLVDCQGTTMELSANLVVNAAGLGGVDIIKNMHGFPQDKCPSISYVKGSYYTLTGKTPFKHLVYPVPENGGLGVHLTLDLAGRARFGPDVEKVDFIDYKVSDDRKNVFYKEIRKYWPNLPDDSLIPAYSGIRPKIYFGDELHADFLIQGEKEHGVKGLINLFGIESPGLTSSMAIADLVTEMV